MDASIKIIKRPPLPLAHIAEALRLSTVFAEHALISGEGFSSYSSDAQLHQKYPHLLGSLQATALAELGPGWRVLEMWANVTAPGSWTKPHNHLTDRLTSVRVAVLYVDKPERSGDIVIEGEAVPAETGDLIIFDGALTHWTEANGSDRLRVVITTNLTDR